MMKRYTDKQNYALECLAYADISKDFSPGMKLVDLVEEPYASQLKDAGLGHLEIIDYTNNNASGSHSGFCAIAFRDPTSGDRGMSFRGTENMDNFFGENQVDMMDNVQTALSGESVQKQEALAFFARNKGLYGDNYLYGHSKGAELATQVYVANYDEVCELHVLNPQPINPYPLTTAQREALKRDAVDVVIIDGDTVHSLGAWPFSEENKRIIQNNGKGEGFFGPHYKESATLDGDNYAIETHPYDKYPEQKMFCLTVQPIVQSAQKGYLPRNYVFFYSLSVIYTFVVRDIPMAIEKFKAAVIGAVKIILDTKEKLERFINDFEDFVQITVTKIKRSWQNVFDRGYKEAIQNPRITANTYHLSDYAQRLRNVNRRLSDLDKRIDDLYWKVGLENIWELTCGDLGIGWSYRIDRCSTYLSGVAKDLESVETALTNSL